MMQNVLLGHRLVRAKSFHIFYSTSSSIVNVSGQHCLTSQYRLKTDISNQPGANEWNTQSKSRARYKIRKRDKQELNSRVEQYWKENRSTESTREDCDVSRAQQINRKGYEHRVGSWNAGEARRDKYLDRTYDDKYKQFGGSSAEGQSGLQDSHDSEPVKHMSAYEGDEDRMRFKYLDEKYAEERKKYFITIQRKYYKTQEELDLLTWDAKEQIRYLHKMDPHEWTSERLAESFPASRKRIVKILKKRPRAMSVEALVDHDKRIMSNWKELADGSRGEGPLRLRYEEMRAQGKLKQLAYAVGNTVLPMPKVTLPDDRMLPTHKGPWSRMVAGYVETQKQAQAAQRSLSQQQQQHLYQLSSKMTLNSMKSLLKAIPEARMSTKPQHTTQTMLQATKATRNESDKDTVNYEKAFASREKDVLTDGRLDIADFSHDEGLSMFDAIENGKDTGSVEDEYEEWMNNKDTRLQSQLAEQYSNKQMSNSDLDGKLYGKSESTGSKFIGQVNIASNNSGNAWIMEERGMAGTQKLSSTNTDDILNEFGKSAKYKQDKNDVFDSIREEFKTNGKNHGRVQTYMYDEQTGYQYPYGKYDDQIVNGIDIPVLPKTENQRERVFQKGRDYFDEDGEFLYRGPT